MYAMVHTKYSGTKVLIQSEHFEATESDAGANGLFGYGKKSAGIRHRQGCRWTLQVANTSRMLPLHDQGVKAGLLH